MSRLSRYRPSPAMIVALVALFVSLGGSATAAVMVTGKQVKNGSLTGADVKNNSLTSKDIKNLKGKDIKDGSLGAVDFAAGELPAGPQGPVGPQGPPGEDATVLWAFVNHLGVLVAGRGAVSVNPFTTGRYTVVFDRDVSACIAMGNAGFGPQTPAGSVYGLNAVVSVYNHLQPNPASIEVRTQDTTLNTPEDNSFMVAVFC